MFPIYGFIYFYTYIRILGDIMVYKRKLTLSIRGDLIDEVKKIVVERGESLSSVVEKYFEYLVFTRWVDELARDLELGSLEPTTSSEIPSGRPKGFDTARIVRELRNKRSGMIGIDDT